MPRPDVSEERIAQIIEASLTVFAREGFAQARMEDIAKTAGLGKGTVYLYFKSKDAIIVAMLKWFFQRDMQQALAQPLSEAPIRDQLLQWAATIAQSIERLRPFWPIVFEFYAVAGRRQDVRQFLLGAFEQYQALLTALIQRGIDQGEFRPIKADELALTMLALFDGLVLFWGIARDQFSWQQQAQSAITHLLDGIMLSPSP